MALSVTAVRFTPAAPDDVASGLIGYVRVTLNGRLLVDGVTVRRSKAGNVGISYPTRRDREGQRHALLRPLGCGTRAELDAQILAALRRGEHLP